MPAVSIASPFIGPVRKWATNSFGTDGSLATSRDTFFALLSIIRSFAFVMPRTQNYGQALPPFTLLSHLSQLLSALSIHERPSPNHPRFAVAGHASYSSRASGTITFSDSCRRITSHFASAYRVACPVKNQDTDRSPGVTLRSSVPCRPQTPLVRWVNEKCLRLHSAGSTLPHLWPTGSSWGSPLDYSPVLLRIPFGFRLATDTLSSEARREVAPGRSWLYPAFAFVPV